MLIQIVCHGRDNGAERNTCRGKVSIDALVSGTERRARTSGPHATKGVKNKIGKWVAELQTDSPMSTFGDHESIFHPAPCRRRASPCPRTRSGREIYGHLPDDSGGGPPEQRRTN